MSQTSIIFFYLIAAFVVFVTARGELPKYIQILTGGGQPAQQQASSGGTLQQIGSIASTAAEITGFVG